MATAMPKHDVVKVVDEMQVEPLTRAGWRLEEVLKEQHIETFEESTPIASGSTSGGTYVSNYTGKKGFVVSKVRYLMKQDGNKALAEMDAKLKEAEQISWNAQHGRQDAEKKAEALDIEAKQLRNTQENLMGRITAQQDQLNKAQGANRKLESDIAKIRSAVGELKMKEILAT